MLRFELPVLIEAVAILNHLQQVASDLDGPVDSEGLSSTILDLYLQLSDHGLTVSAKSLGRMLTIIHERQSLKVLAGEVRLFNRALIDEIEGKAVFMLTGETAKYHGTAIQLFGELVTKTFPSQVSDDIEEAGKCLAFNRATAGVFHLMRVLESGLKLLATNLGVDYRPSWDSYIDHITAKVNQKHKDKPEEWKEDEPFFKSILGDLGAIKIAWRNPTMHIDRRYTEEEAEQIYISVRTIMQRIAARYPCAKE